MNVSYILSWMEALKPPASGWDFTLRVLEGCFALAYPYLLSLPQQAFVLDRHWLRPASILGSCDARGVMPKVITC